MMGDLARTLLVLAWLGLLTGCAALRQNTRHEQAFIQWGLSVESIRLSANGNMVDCRLRVLDEKRAAPFFKRQVKPLLIDENSGQKLGVLSSGKIGALRHSYQPLNGRVYPILFANMHGIIKKGSRVAIEIGEMKISNLLIW